jgi:DNA-binding NtrC family response regulator
LVADEPCLAHALDAQVHSVLGQSALVCSFDSIRDYLGPDRHGLLVLAAASAADSKRVVRLVQDVSLLKWPATILVLADKAARTKHMNQLQGRVAQFLRWPTDARQLGDLLKQPPTTGPIQPIPKEKGLEEVLGRSLLRSTPSLLPLVSRLVLASQHDVPVLLTGETGTGKSYLARLIHQASPRKRQGFLVTPCGALVSTLIESELFGHAAGAFTGADRARQGKFAAAGTGTLLLDEIDALGLDGQAKLMRVFDTGEFEPVGSNDVQHCKARIMVASNWNLEEAAKQGRFRRDLYYRLSVLSFHLPPLRERVEDIEPLVRAMAVRFSNRFQKELFDISSQALATLQAFPWPGNIRQLENAVQQAVLVSQGPLLLFEHLASPIRDYRAPTAEATNDSLVPPFSSPEQSEQTILQETLDRCGCNRTRAAASLGISRTTLYHKLKKHGFWAGPGRQLRLREDK